MAPFIVIEGPDGAGTTTHSNLLSEELQSRGHDVLLTAQPSDGPIGRFIKTALSANERFPADALQLLFTADRAWHVENIVKPALRGGKMVVSDRYLPSTLAYGEALGLDPAWLLELNKNFIQPDVTIFLLPSLETCIQRIAARPCPDSLEARGIQERVHASYRRLSQADDTILVFDSGAPVQEVFEQILMMTRNFFP